MNYIKVNQSIAKLVWEKTDEVYIGSVFNPSMRSKIDVVASRGIMNPHMWHSFVYNKYTWYINKEHINYIPKILRVFYKE